MRLDHVLVAVRDLAAAAQEMDARFGLSSIEGGRHPAWGTANRIVPLGESYLELVAVFDRAAAAESVFGRWVLAGASGKLRPLGWALRTARIEDVAQRLGLTVQAGSRTTPGGDQLRWRSAGVDQAAGEPSLPFFIEWSPDSKLPGNAPVHHRAGSARIAGLVLDAEPGRLAAWMGSHQIPIVVREGMPGVAAVQIATDAGERFELSG